MHNIQESQGEGQLEINLPSKTFADIIINFLGKKEKLNYKHKAYFQLTHNQIEQFYYLLEEKISKEQFIHVELFTVSIGYSDGTTRTLNTIETLQSFYEPRNVTPISIVLTWNIVLNFPNATTVENQKIEVLFNIEKNKWTDGHAEIFIEHTNSAWGIEVLTLFQNHIKNITDSKINFLVKFYDEITTFNSVLPRYISFLVFMIIFLFSFIISILFVNIHTAKSYEFKYDAFNIIEKNQLSEDEKIILYIHINQFNVLYYRDENDIFFDKYPLIKELAEKNVKSFYENMNKFFIELAYFWGSLIIGCIIIIFWLCSYACFYRKKSFILITDEAKKSYEKFQYKKNKANFFSVSTVLITILLGLITNLIYRFIFIVL